MNQSLKKQLKELYSVPEPVGKDSFLKKLNYPKSTFREFLLTQAGYIYKYVWILSAVLVFFAAAAGAHVVNRGIAFPVLWCVSSVMPVLALILVLETFRSERHGMDELEQASKHNLPEVLLVRMGVIAVTDIILIGAVVPVIIRYDGMSFFRVAVYLLVPYLFTCFLTLCIQRRKKGKETVWYGVLVSVFTGGSNLTSYFIGGLMYEEKRFFFWLLAFILLGAASARQIKKIRKNREEYGWNLYLTE